MNGPIARCLSATICILLVPASALALPKVGGHDNGFSKAEERGLHVYVECWDAFKSQCGRNIVDDGLASGAPPSDARVREWTATMDRWLNPPEPTVASSTSSGVALSAPVTTSVPPAPVATGGGYASSSTVQCESGGDYSVNTGNGYTGGYQFDSQTWDAYGDSAYEEAYLAPPAVQDAAAASVPYDAWPNC